MNKETLEYVQLLRKTLEPFRDYGEAVPDNWSRSQQVTIALNYPPEGRLQKPGHTVLDIALSVESFRNAQAVLAIPVPEALKEVQNTDQ